MNTTDKKITKYERFINEENDTGPIVNNFQVYKFFENCRRYCSRQSLNISKISNTNNRYSAKCIPCKKVYFIRKYIGFMKLLTKTLKKVLEYVYLTTKVVA